MRNRFYLVYVLLLLACLPAAAQLAIWRSELADERPTVVIEANYQLARHYTGRDLDSARYHIDAAVALAERTDDPDALARTYWWSGVVSQYQADLDGSLEYYLKGLSITKEHDLTKTEGRLYNSIGITYEELGENDLAKQYYFRALDLNLAEGRPEQNPGVLNNLGAIYQRERKLDSASLIFRRAKSIMAEHKVDTNIMIAILYGEARVNHRRDRFDEAITDFQRAAELSEPSGNTYRKTLIQSGLIKAMIYGGYPDRADALLAKQLPIILENEYAYQLKDYYRERVNLDSVRGDYRSAFYHHRRFKSVSDSIVDLQRKKTVSELEAKYELKEKETSLASLTSENERQRRHSVMLCIIVGLTALLALQTYRRFRISKSAERLAATRLEEKSLLMEELRHRAKNNLSTIEGLLGLQAEALGPGVDRSALLKSRRRVQSINLLNQQLEDQPPGQIDMRDYLTKLLDELTGRQSIIGYQLKAEPIKVDVNTAVPLGLIVNEAVTNTIDHAFDGPPDPARHSVTVSLNGTADAPERIVLEVIDNGNGYPELKSTRVAGKGLSLIEGLVKQLRGKFLKHNTPGAALRIQLPLFTA